MVNTLGQLFFKWRDLLPVPLVLLLLRGATPARRTWLLGLPLILIGELIRLWSLMHIGPTTRTRAICADRLVTSGPYGWSRNPLYLANLSKVTGILLVAGNAALGLLILAFYALEFFCLIRYEEDFLRRTFPQEFDAYARTVPAFFPGLGGGIPSPTPGGEAATYSFGEALRSEKRTFASTGLLLLVLRARQALNDWNAGTEGAA